MTVKVVLRRASHHWESSQFLSTLDSCVLQQVHVGHCVGSQDDLWNLIDD